MALYKEKISDNGVVSKYHNLGSVSLRKGRLVCHVNSYASKEYRDNNAEPVVSIPYTFICSVEEEESMGIRKLVYTKLKTLEEWQDAEDC